MEIRTKELDQLLAAERDANRLHEQRCTELAAFLVDHRKLKHSWRTALTECNDKYEASCLANAALGAENQRLRTKLLRQQPAPRAEANVQYGEGRNVIYVTAGGGSGDGGDRS